MRYLKNDRLYCFSPPIMIITFVIEILCAAWVVYRYKLTPVTRIVTAILISLSVFQLAEYNVCEGAFGISSLDWARVGYVAITLLPPLGIHLAATMAGVRARKLIGVSYGLALAFGIFFLTVGHGMQGSQCLGNYVIFQTAPQSVVWYALYYYGLLVVGVLSAYRWAGKAKSSSVRRALYGLVVGYLAFMVPTTTVNFLDPATVSGIPSIMCGFAVSLAVILTGFVVPEYMKTKEGVWIKLREALKR